jgi:hypothetical protein
MPFFDKTKLEGHYFYSVDSVTPIETMWLQLLSTKPEFVKLILGFSEVYRSGEAGQMSLGLHPQIAKEIVRKARAAGLPSPYVCSFRVAGIGWPPSLA